LINISSPATLRGWVIPTATDIAFAVAVLAIIATHLPSALRIFLLTLAVIDDLIGISIIGVAYASYIKPWPCFWHWYRSGYSRFWPGTMAGSSEPGPRPFGVS
jgi:Na+/H+ antiporter NhaA